MSGEANYQNVLQSLRRPTADQVVADILVDYKRAIDAQKESIEIQAKTIETLHKIVALRDEIIAVLRGTNAA